MNVSNYDIKFAQERLLAASEAWRAAQCRVEGYGAELLRLQLRRLFDDCPELQKVSLESEYEYDDEGGYFQVINIYAAVDDEYPTPGEYDAQDEASQITPWSTGAVAKVLGFDEWDGSEFWLTREDIDSWDAVLRGPAIKDLSEP